MAITLKDRMTSDLVRLRLDTKVDEARAALAGHPERLGAVFDDQDRPVTLLSPADLEARAGVPEQAPAGQTLVDLPGGLPPGIVAPSGMTVDAFVDSGVLVSLDLGARGALVIEDGQVVGALTEESIDEYLPRHEERALTRGADVGLAGGILTGKVVLYCEEYRHRNELAYYNRRKPPLCQVATPHPHPIRKM
jgi:CBS domain-containing protein